MTPPSRLQIEATFALPIYRVDIWDITAVTPFWRSVSNSDVVSISGSVESTGNQDNGLSFGTAVEPSANVAIENVVFATNYLLSDTIWIGTRMRILFGFDTSDLVVQFVGVIKERQLENNTVTFNLVGLTHYIQQTKLYTEIQYHVPIATKTTIASIEDPSDPSYAAGLINRIFFESGGRPYEQKDLTYTENSAGFKFWYSCEQALFGPEYAWLSGEDLVDELYSLARAGGGQIYQDHLGIMRYIQPLTLGDVSTYGGTYYTFTDAVFDGYNDRLNNEETVRTVTAKFTRRYIAPLQTIYEDKTPRLFLPNETKVLIFNPQLPIWEYINLEAFSAVTATNIKAQLINGVDVTPGINDVTIAATQVTISIWNPSATYPMEIYSVKLQGRPLAPAPELQTAVGSGTPEKNLEQSVYIQTEEHAYRLAKLVYDFYYDIRPILTLNNVQYDPDRFVGEIVKVQSTYNRTWNGSSYVTNNTLYRIIKISHDGIGTSMSIDLVSVAGIPSKSTMFIIGNSYSGSDNRSLSY